MDILQHRELGYDKVEDHIRECTILEMKKKKLIIAKEQERLSKSSMAASATAKNEILNEEDGNNNEDEEEEAMERTRVKLDEESEPEEEEDEDMALAREIEESEGAHLQVEESMVNDYTQDDADLEGSAVDEGGTDGITPLDTLDGLKDGNGTAIGTGELMVEDHTQAPPTFKDDGKESEEPKDVINVASSEGNTKADENGEEGTTEEEVETEFDDSSVAVEKKKSQNRPKNAGWKALLKKEAELLKKQKARKSNLVDAEAEEEEEEEDVAGLEDFGFTVDSTKKANDDEEDDADDADDEDFENIVDDLSDNEGDEEAGEAARKALTQKEEKLRHKEIIRRMRDGYDGKRGGIAGGAGTARGNLRFDQLVAADNRADAKKLGLANEDEFDSDDEETPKEKNSNEIEDEAALVDKMLKDRYLNRTDIPAEDFSDEEDDEEDGNDESESTNLECIYVIIIVAITDRPYLHLTRRHKSHSRGRGGLAAAKFGQKICTSSKDE